MGFVVFSSALSRLVVAHDCPNADIETLTELYAAKSEGEVSMGLRWLYCGGMAISLACMGTSDILDVTDKQGFISIAHIHKDFPGQRSRKLHRLIVRYSVVLIIALLPLAGDRLNSLNLISVTTSLIVTVLISEIWGGSSRHDGFFGERMACHYTTDIKIKKKELEKASNEDGTLNANMISGDDTAKALIQ